MTEMWEGRSLSALFCEKVRVVSILEYYLSD